MSSNALAFAEEGVAFTDEERINWLRLIRSENIGIKTFNSLLKMYGSAEKAIEKAGEMSLRGGREKPITIFSYDRAEQEIANCRKIGARIIALPEPEYPALLRQISDAPPIITVLGNTDILNHQTIAVVGARNASANGCRFAYKIAEKLGEHNYVVVSGLARGIDAAAHKGSLQSGTIAVIAGGIDHIYPRENEALYNNIKENGAIIAELPIGTAPKAQHFPQRNRIISGISLGTIVVEASTKSGSLITARCALEQNREVFAVPGSPLDPRCEGPNKLIKQGAVLTESIEDIIDNINHPPANKNYGAFAELDVDAGNDFLVEPDEQNISNARNTIKSLLSSTAVEVDELIGQSGLPTQIVQVVLLELELAESLIRHPGNKVSLLISN